ncbi:hypothetical protein B5M09_005279, partial [Aphanomyces astaci]
MDVCPCHLPLQVHEEYIVSFTTYDTLPALASRLDNVLATYESPVSASSSSLHRQIQRHNIPTDFVVWHLHDMSLSVIRWLRIQPGIKSIVRNRRLQLTSLTTTDPTAARQGTHLQHLIRMPFLMFSVTVDTFTSSSASWNYMDDWDISRLRAQNITGVVLCPLISLSLPPPLPSTYSTPPTPPFFFFLGHGIKVAIFDTGVDPDHARRHFRHVEDIVNWTDEPLLRDSDGHGSFVAGIIASVHPACPGIAPDVRLVSFRVFTSTSASYTSWLLDALNFALFLDVDVLNFSFGGPDFADAPFVDKIHECAANGVVIVSAVGNHGPQYGSVTNPADQIDVLGVGGLGLSPSTVRTVYDSFECVIRMVQFTHIARFSARGQTLWEINSGYGRVKPDAVAPSMFVRGLSGENTCRLMNGTSMAAPLASGMSALVLSRLTPSQRSTFGHVGFLKGLFLQTATRLPSLYGAWVLWDQFRNVQYPSGYIPHDNLHQQVDPFDSQGDHPHTNFCDFFHRLLSHHHLFVEVLTTDYTCVGDWSLYGVLVITDPEDSWFASEVALVDAAVRRHDGLSVVVIADWFNPGLVRHHMSFWDATTLSTWQPVTGGANVPAINTLLAGFGVGLSSHVWSNVELLYMSGSALIDLPDPSFVLYANLTQDTKKDRGVDTGLFKQDMKEMAIAAMVQIQGGGRIVVYGDSSCVDSSTVSQMEHGTVSMYDC